MKWVQNYTGCVLEKWKSQRGCVKYLCKFNKAVVGVPPFLICPILLGHDLAEVTDGHVDTFFVVLHRAHEDISQVLHQLNLRWKWDDSPLRTDWKWTQRRRLKDEAPWPTSLPDHRDSWGSDSSQSLRPPGWRYPPWAELPQQWTPSGRLLDTRRRSDSVWRHAHQVLSPYLYWASNGLIGETQPNSLKTKKITLPVFWWCRNTLVFIDDSSITLA